MGSYLRVLLACLTLHSFRVTLFTLGLCLFLNSVVYCESLKRELKTKPKYAFRCDERLKTKVEESTLPVCIQLVAELEHLKIETRLIDEMFASEMGEYVF